MTARGFYPDSTVADIVTAYERGERLIANVQIDGADFGGCDLGGATFLMSSLRDALFDGAQLVKTSFVKSDLRGATFTQAHLLQSLFDEVVLSGARLDGAQLSYASLVGVYGSEADFTGCDLTMARLAESSFPGAMLDGVRVGGTTFADVDLSDFCNAAVVSHMSPSYVDFRSVLGSLAHPGLKRFLVACGVPPLVAEYAIAAAQAEGDALASLMRSTFISYGGPDEPFARRLYEELRAHGVTTFFFPETARLGRRIGDEVHSRIQEHDRVILVCSRESLDRPGVRNEIQETFDREARDGGATYLLPIMLDDYVLSGWNDPLAARVRGRVVGDFRGAMTDAKAFDRAMSRLLAALRKDLV